MLAFNNKFAHVLLFACPLCERPLSSACFNTKRSLEDADAHWFNPHCHCGWTGDVRGITAVKHWVQPWQEPKLVRNDNAGSCDGNVDREVNRVRDPAA